MLELTNTIFEFDILTLLSLYSSMKHSSNEKPLKRVHITTADLVHWSTSPTISKLMLQGIYTANIDTVLSNKFQETPETELQSMNITTTQHDFQSWPAITTECAL